MRSSTAEQGLRRLVTGNRCDVQRCYEMALWLLSDGDESLHLCAKHIRISMRDPTRWKRGFNASVDGQT